MNLYLCKGCNSCMCLFCGSVNVTEKHFFGQVRISCCSGECKVLGGTV